MAREFKKAPFAEFEDASVRTGMNMADLCESMGYSPGAYSGWQKDDCIPYVASVALRTIVAEHLKVAMIYVPEADFETVRKIVIGCGGTFRTVRI